MNKSKIMLLTLIPLLLTGCPQKTISSSSLTSSSQNSNSSTQQNYYDENNFVEPNNQINQTKIVTYDGPSLLAPSSKVAIEVDSHPLFVYETRVNHKRVFTYDYSTDTAPYAIFDFEGSVNIKMTINTTEPIEYATVSPKIYGIIPTVNQNIIEFTLNYPANYTIEYHTPVQEGQEDTYYKNSIHLFANPLEETPYTPSPTTTYIGPGIYSAGAIPLTSNGEIYLAGGAVVYGQIRTEGYENITIRGRGILAGDIYSRQTQSEYTIPIEIRTTNNVTIEGITIVDPAGWAVALFKSTNIVMDNVKIITARANGDGISVQSCSNVLVKGGFVRSWDDSLVVKNTSRGSTSNVVFDGVVVWTDLAQSMEVGYETNGPTMDDITFKNITVIHNFHKPVISLHNSDDANINHVTYQNITVEDGQMLGDNRNDGENDFFIDFTIAFSSEWSLSGGVRGKVSNILVKDVNVYQMASSVVSRMNGESATSNIDGVVLSNIYLPSGLVSSASDLKLSTNSYVQNLSFSNSNTNTKGAIITLPYKLNITQPTPIYNNIQNIQQNGLIVPEFAHLQGDLPYIGIKKDIVVSPSTSLGSGTTATTPVNGIASSFEDPSHPITNLFDHDKDTTYVGGNWTNVDKEFAGITLEFEENQIIGVLRLYGIMDSNLFFEYEIEIWCRKNKSDGTMNDAYTRLAAARTYIMTPSSGNVIDIKITAQEYRGLQLRIKRNDTIKKQQTLQFSEIEFYPPSLSFGKTIVAASEYADVYPVNKLVDGEVGGTSYYESKSLPAYVILDLGKIETISTIVLHLPPVLTWNTRHQTIAISYNADNLAYNPSSPPIFTSLVPATAYEFNPASGNMVVISLTSTDVRFVRFDITTNDIGLYGAQLSEINIY